MIYLIDFENVSNDGFTGIESLSENDSIYVFYSENVKNITISTHKKIESSKVKKEYIEVKTAGKNALDFQLSTFLDSLISLDKNEEYAIISKDEGYKAVIDFWKSRNIKILKYPNLINQTKDSDSIKDKVAALLPNNKNDINDIVMIIDKYKTKQGINNALVKLYKSEKAGVLYKLIKPLINDKKGK